MTGVGYIDGGCGPDYIIAASMGAVLTGFAGIGSGCSTAARGGGGAAGRGVIAFKSCL